MISNESFAQIIEEGLVLDEGQLGIARKRYLSEIVPFLQRKEAIILKGLRRSGKSTIMKQLMRELIMETNIPKENVIYVNLEDYRLVDSLSFQLLELFLEVGMQKADKKQPLYLFIDEIQLIQKWEKWVRTHYDQNRGVKFVISGSCASLLEREYSTALTGRNITFLIKPLSFGEFIFFRRGVRLEALLAEYLEFGGFPEIALAEGREVKKRLLKQYAEDIINKDIINRHKIRNPRQVYLLAKYITSNTGQKISCNKIAKAFGLSVETAICYLQHMVEAYLISEVPFHSYSVKVKYDKAKLPKYFLSDNGLISIMDADFSKNFGRRCENAVFIRLSGERDLTYWQEKKEVDFVFGDTGVNVTASSQIPPREFEGLEELKKSDKNIKKLIIVAPDVSGNKEEIALINLSSFLLGGTNHE